MGTLSSVSRTSRMSGVLAPLTAAPNGTPAPSVSTLRLVPRLARSVGFLPVFFPPERGLGHGSVQRLPLPIDPLEVLVFLEGDGPQLAEEALFDQPLEIAMDGAAGAELPRDGLPLAAGAQDIENAVEGSAPTEGGPPALTVAPPLGQ